MNFSIPNKVFITGTDTEIGKTYVTCKLLADLTKSHSAEGLKPLVSGGLEDIELIHKASSQTIKQDERYLLSFAPAVAPHIAAEKTNTVISDKEIITFMCQNFKADYTVIEGFGGWLAPINLKQTMGELVIASKIPIILVVGMRLGCINHALLTASNIKQNGGELYGWIANTLGENMPELKANIKTIASFIGQPLAIY